MRVIREFTEPTNIIIADAWIDHDDFNEHKIMITDDECGFMVSNGTKSVGVESFGFAYVLTEEEFMKHVNSDHFENHEREYEDWQRYVVINNFVGKVSLKVTTYEGEDVTSTLNLKDYIQHQLSEWGNVEIVVSNNYEIAASPLGHSLKKFESGVSSKMTDILSEETKEQLFGEIENEGFGYWVQHYGYKGDEDPELEALCQAAQSSLNKLEQRLRTLGVEI